MSFLRHGEIYRSDGGLGADLPERPHGPLRPIVSMSFQLVIPWRVALQQSPPPLHQPVPILHYGRQVVQCFCSERQTVS